MYYTDRTALGNLLAEELLTIVPNSAVLVNLKPSAAPTCSVIAQRLHCWTFDLVYEPVMYPGDPTRPLGAVTAGGGFCVHPAISGVEFSYVAQEFQGWLADAKRMALHRLHQNPVSEHASVDRWLLQGKPIVLVADVLADTLALAAVRTVLQPLRLEGICAAVGNVTANVYDALRLQTDACVVQQVLPGHVFADDHYFSGPNTTKQHRPKHIIMPLHVAGSR